MPISTPEFLAEVRQHNEKLDNATRKRCSNCGYLIDIKDKMCIARNFESLCEFVAPARVNLQGINTIPEFVSAAYIDACDRGWHEKPREIPEVTNLFHEEAAEMFREYRDGRGATEIYTDAKGKPAGFPIELADLVIRAFDAAGEFGIDLQAVIVQKMEFNRTRPHRHGGKRC